MPGEALGIGQFSSHVHHQHALARTMSANRRDFHWSSRGDHKLWEALRGGKAVLILLSFPELAT